jgi:hypothetical protein
MKKAPETTAGGPYPEEACNEIQISLGRATLGGAFVHDDVADPISWMKAHGLSTGEIEEAINETLILLVRAVLGGAFVHDAVADFLWWQEADGRTLSTGEIAELLWYLASLGGADGVRKTAENIVLNWAMEMAADMPIDNRARVLVHEWCRRRVGLENGVGKKAGRPADDNVKKAAVLFAIAELAKTYPNQYGAKKQIYNHLQIKFGLRRSQLSKLLSGYDPWEVREAFSASRTPSDKSD